MSTVKKVVTIIISVILWLIILLAALFAFTTLATRDTNNVADIAGFTPMTVSTDSMKPTFCAGDMIVVQKCDPNTLKVGDIITFHTIIDNEYALNTHRIESISENNGFRSYTTKGDNNQVSDTHVISSGDIVGKEIMVLPGVGNVMTFLSSPAGFLIVIVLPMLVFFIYQVYHLITVSISLKRAVAEEERMAQAQKIVDGELTVKVETPIDDVAAAEEAKAKAEAALAEAMRLKAEAEAALASVNNAENGAGGKPADSEDK